MNSGDDGEILQRHSSGDRLLDCLPVDCAARLLSAASTVHLPVGYSLLERDRRPQFVYFLTSGIASVVFNSERGTSVELSTEGCEGIVGWLPLLGPLPSEDDCGMHVEGSGYRLPLSVIQREFDESADIRRRVLEYAQHQMAVANQVLACNRLHRAEARFSCRLLIVSDRIASEDLSTTQEFMSIMLGTRRTTVAEVAGNPARAGAVEGRRGGLRVANRKALESRACECFRILRGRYLSLYHTPSAGRDVSRGVVAGRV